MGYPNPKANEEGGGKRLRNEAKTKNPKLPEILLLWVKYKREMC